MLDRGVMVLDVVDVAFALIVTVDPTIFVTTVPSVIPVPDSLVPICKFTVDEAVVIVGLPLIIEPVNVANVCSFRSQLNPANPLLFAVPLRYTPV